MIKTKKCGKRKSPEECLREPFRHFINNCKRRIRTDPGGTKLVKYVDRFKIDLDPLTVEALVVLSLSDIRAEHNCRADELLRLVRSVHNNVAVDCLDIRLLIPHISRIIELISDMKLLANTEISLECMNDWVSCYGAKCSDESLHQLTKLANSQMKGCCESVVRRWDMLESHLKSTINENAKELIWLALQR